MCEIHLQWSARLGADQILIALRTCAREVPTIDWKSAVGAVHGDNSISFLPYGVSLSSQVISVRSLQRLGILAAQQGYIREFFGRQFKAIQLHQFTFFVATLVLIESLFGTT
jgi:hypothetical protein